MFPDTKQEGLTGSHDWILLGLFNAASQHCYHLASFSISQVLTVHSACHTEGVSPHTHRLPSSNSQGYMRPYLDHIQQKRTKVASRRSLRMWKKNIPKSFQYIYLLISLSQVQKWVTCLLMNLSLVRQEIIYTPLLLALKLSVEFIFPKAYELCQGRVDTRECRSSFRKKEQEKDTGRQSRMSTLFEKFLSSLSFILSI